MRIRKHAKTSFLPFSHASIPPSESSRLGPHVCELNRSPWDLLSFESELSHATGDYQVTGNGSGRETLGAAESVASLEAPLGNNEEERGLSSSLLGEEKKEKKRGVCCSKTDGKGWKCKKEAKEGHLLCEHHLLQLRSYSHNYHNNCSNRKSGEKKGVAGVPRRKRSKISSSAKSLGNCYYSGFGGVLGKRRGRGEEAKREGGADGLASYFDGYDNHDEDEYDDEDYDDNDNSKRFRKPRKSRSLKSLL